MNSKELKFSEVVCSSIGNYVYRLIDPRNGETFYVGKGKGNRVFDHIKCDIQNLSIESDDAKSEKIQRIIDIHNEGLEVIHVIHRHGIPDDAVFEVEAALIDVFSGLTNDQGGHGSYDRGPMNAQQIINKFELPEFEMDPPEKLIFINVNAIQDKSNPISILQQVQCCWRVDVKKAQQAKYVLAVQRGVVIGAFQECNWLKATSENFPGKESDPYRYGFVGKVADKDVWTRFVGEHGKRVINPDQRHVQNPIRYWKI